MVIDHSSKPPFLLKLESLNKCSNTFLTLLPVEYQLLSGSCTSQKSEKAGEGMHIRQETVNEVKKTIFRHGYHISRRKEREKKYSFIYKN